MPECTITKMAPSIISCSIAKLKVQINIWKPSIYHWGHEIDNCDSTLLTEKVIKFKTKSGLKYAPDNSRQTQRNKEKSHKQTKNYSQYIRRVVLSHRQGPSSSVFSFRGTRGDDGCGGGCSIIFNLKTQKTQKVPPTQ